MRIKRIDDSREDSEAYTKILHWFFSFPTKEFGLNELSEELKISKTTANKVIKKLEKEGFLRIENLGRLWRISCKKRHVYFRTRKIPHNLLTIYESGLIEAIHKIIPNPRSIILFGSYRKGDDTEKSDIDIAVEVLDDKEVEIISFDEIPQIGYRKDIPVNLYVFNRNKVDLNLFANIANGIILDGFLEVKP